MIWRVMILSDIMKKDISIEDFAKVFGDIESENELNGKQKNKSM